MRSEVTSRSNWANDNMTLSVSRPIEVVVLNCWVTETNDTPHERSRIGGDLCDGSFSETAPLQSAGRFCTFFSGPEIPFPGNGDRERQRLGSNAGYAEGSPSIWCCRDHSADMSARRATPMP